MYSVVGCSDCEALWVVEGRPETTGCPRCGRRHRFDRLRRLAESEDEDEARQARTAILAERSGESGALADLGTFAELADRTAREDAVTDEEYLRAAGIDPDEVVAAAEGARADSGAANRVDVVRTALRELESPTTSAVVAYAAARDVPRPAARALLDRLVEAGEATEDRGRYRLL